MGEYLKEKSSNDKFENIYFPSFFLEKVWKLPYHYAMLIQHIDPLHC